MKFNTSLDGFAKTATIAVSLLFLIIIISLQRNLFVRPGADITSNVMSIALISIYLIAYLFRPLQYEITNRELVIHRPAKNIIILKKDIISIELVDKDKMNGTVRMFGVGGLFGYFGKFANFKLGSMTWYATRKDKIVLVTVKDNQKIVLTPDEPEKFVRQFLL